MPLEQLKQRLLQLPGRAAQSSRLFTSCAAGILLLPAWQQIPWNSQISCLQGSRDIWPSMLFDCLGRRLCACATGVTVACGTNAFKLALFCAALSAEDKGCQSLCSLARSHRRQAGLMCSNHEASESTTWSGIEPVYSTRTHHDPGLPCLETDEATACANNRQEQSHESSKKSAGHRASMLCGRGVM